MSPRATLVDANVVIDLATADPRWGRWSARAVARLGQEGPLAINPLVYAELAAAYASPRELDRVVPTDVYERRPLPWGAAFLAGRCFVRYRRAGGARRSPLPDFYIGAHAQVEGLRLLTRDAGRYRTYFPELELVAPDG